MELTMSPEHVGPMRRAYFPRMLVQSPRGCCPPSTFSQCPRVCSSNTRGTSERCCRIRGAYSEGRFQERKKLTMVKAQAYLKAGKMKKPAHGNFADYSEIMAENYVSKYVVGDEEVEQAMLGEIDPNCRMTTHLS